MNLPNYKYRATALSGKMVRGTMMASDPEALLNELKKKDLFLLDYSQTNRTSFGAKLKPKELTDFCRQLGSLLEAGVSVIQSFNIIANRSSCSKVAKKVFSEISTDLKHGKALSEAMADQGNCSSAWCAPARPAVKLGRHSSIWEHISKSSSASALR